MGGINAGVGVAGSPRVLHYRIGAANEPAALSLARTLLATQLVLSEMRTYEYKGILAVRPEPGLTIGVDETDDGVVDYVGVVRSINVSVAPEEITVFGDVLDYDAAVIT